jgi:RNA 2',3'-cyclic 3'-phosphodiesterase
MIRIFVAYPIKKDLAKSLLELQDKNSSVENIRWTPEVNLHITLFFIGEIEEKNLDVVKTILKNTLSECKSFDLEFDGIVFKGKKHPSMIWGLFKKSPSFSQLSEKIYQSAKGLMTIVPSHLDPLPHCTIARIKVNCDTSRIDLNTDIKGNPLVKVELADLWQTIQSNDGVRYQCLDKYLFKH